jgi:cellulose biosynthesis protein BcsQ
MPDVTFDTTIETAIAAIESAGIDLSGCEITLLRDLLGRLRLHVAHPRDMTWPSDARARLKQAMLSVVPYATDVVYVDKLAAESSFPMIDALRKGRRSVERSGSPAKWYRFERRFSKDAWLDETGNPREPWPFNERPAVVSFYGFKGGVGRTTALAAFGLFLSDAGKNVVAVDLDLEAPGLMPLLGDPGVVDLGVLDFLIEERVGHPRPLPLERFYVSSPHGGRIGSLRVFPPGRLDEHYVEKLGRIDLQGLVEPEHAAGRLLLQLLQRIRSELTPDAILLDVRAGLHDIGGLSLAGLSHMELLFAVHSTQTWRGLPLVLRHLGRLRADWIRLVHAMVPPATRGGDEVHRDFVSRAFNECSDSYYVAGEIPDLGDESAAHHAYRLPFREALLGVSDLGSSRAELLADEHRVFCERLARDLDLVP